MSELCKDCGKSGYPDAAGGLQHDRRSVQGNAPEGKERRAPLPGGLAASKLEKPPRREHILNRPLLDIFKS